MFRSRPAFVSFAGMAVATIVVLSVSMAPHAAAEAPFNGDYSTGDFSQWHVVQTRNYNGLSKDFEPNYSASVVQDVVKGDVARYEVRPGDVPPFGGGERSEVEGSPGTGGNDGQTRWYRFSTKFDSSFPLNHADLGWGVTNQWHAINADVSPPVSWTVDQRNGFWSLTIDKQSAPGVYLDAISIFDTPLYVGQWHDVLMQVNWSTSDDRGWIKLWYNGLRQTFTNGADTFFVRTLVPGTSGVYYKEGMYRKPTTSTDVVYHTGFRSADSQIDMPM